MAGGVADGVADGVGLAGTEAVPGVAAGSRSLPGGEASAVTGVGVREAAVAVAGSPLPGGGAEAGVGVEVVAGGVAGVTAAVAVAGGMPGVEGGSAGGSGAGSPQPATAIAATTMSPQAVAERTVRKCATLPQDLPATRKNCEKSPCQRQ